MLSDSDSDGEYDPALPVQVLSTRSLSSYLRSEGFSKCDVQELASESRCMPKYNFTQAYMVSNSVICSGRGKVVHMTIFCLFSGCDRLGSCNSTIIQVLLLQREILMGKLSLT